MECSPTSESNGCCFNKTSTCHKKTNYGNLRRQIRTAGNFCSHCINSRVVILSGGRRTMEFSLCANRTCHPERRRPEILPRQVASPCGFDFGLRLPLRMTRGVGVEVLRNETRLKSSARHPPFRLSVAKPRSGIY